MKFYNLYYVLCVFNIYLTSRICLLKLLQFVTLFVVLFFLVETLFVVFKSPRLMLILVFCCSQEFCYLISCNVITQTLDVLKYFS